MAQNIGSVHFAEKRLPPMPSIQTIMDDITESKIADSPIKIIVRSKEEKERYEKLLGPNVVKIIVNEEYLNFYATLRRGLK